MATSQILAPSLSLYQRVTKYAQLWTAQKFVKLFLRLIRLYKPLSPNQKPTFIKKYPVRNHLTNRIFIPSSHQPGQTHPVLIDIHSGGFAICTPEIDDEFCAHLCHTYNILVVSLDYSKSPAVQFPAARDDITALVEAVLSDESLPIDRTRVAMCGASAGGNLALSVAQSPALRGKIHGLVPLYPVIEFVTDVEQKARTRPYRDSKDIDVLLAIGPMINSGYIAPGQDLTDPTLSISYATKEDLPKWIFMIAAEFDLLSAEAKDMIEKLAGIDESEREELRYGFERGTYRWKLIRGVEHGYNQWAGPSTRGELAQKGTQETFEIMSEWLFKGPFSKKDS